MDLKAKLVEVGVVWCFTVFGLMVYRPTRRWVGRQFIKFVLKKDEEYGDIVMRRNDG